ncbi:MAG: CotH kinase family protein [Clostridia bacterium]|nr:CotH kinase family protein [Clostridia bacterium]
MKRLCLLSALILLFTGCTAEVSTTSVSESDLVDVIATVPTEAPEPPKAFSVSINEVMADNSELTLGHMWDYIELYNVGEEQVDLDGYYLTDDMTAPDALPLTGYSVPAQWYTVVILDGEAPFHLASEGESVYLTDGEDELSRLTYSESAGGISYGADGVCDHPTPGFSNDAEGYALYLDTVTEPPIVINEILPSNSLYPAPDGLTHDMVEIKNVSSSPVELSSYTLSDKRSEPGRYRFPSVTLDPGGFYVVYCSGDASLGEAHASFKLSAEKGESVYLARDGSIFDKVDIPADLPKNESYGRGESGLCYFTGTSIGGENAGGYPSPVAAPVASVPTGVYDTPVTVTLSAEGTVYYTLDGSRPTVSSTVYTEPIEISGVTTLRTFCVSEDRQSVHTAYTYVVGEAHDLPIVCVSIPDDYLNHADYGILNHIEYTVEYECQLTLIEQGTERFSLPCGFRLHGFGSREMPKQNFQLRFRSAYGESKLNYKLFDGLDIDIFDSLLLKGGSEDYASAVMRDEVGTLAVADETALYTQAYKPVVLYLGDEYWGVYYLRERFSDDYVAEHLDVSEESVDLLVSTSGYAQDGSDGDFSALKTYVKTHDMSLDENYEYLCSKIDADSLMDWYICRSYMGDKDLANIRRFRSTETDGKWRWMYFDLDWAFCHTVDAPVTSLLNNYNGEPVLINALLAHEKGRDAFLRRYAHLMDTVLNEEHMCAVVDRIAANIAGEMPRDRKRWGSSVEIWESSVQRIRDYFADGKRDARVLADIQSYFGLTDAQMQEYFG